MQYKKVRNPYVVKVIRKTGAGSHQKTIKQLRAAAKKLLRKEGFLLV